MRSHIQQIYSIGPVLHTTCSVIISRHHQYQHYYCLVRVLFQGKIWESCQIQDPSTQRDQSQVTVFSHCFLSFLPQKSFRPTLARLPKQSERVCSQTQSLSHPPTSISPWFLRATLQSLKKDVSHIFGGVILSLFEHDIHPDPFGLTQAHYM